MIRITQYVSPNITSLLDHNTAVGPKDLNHTHNGRWADRKQILSRGDTSLLVSEFQITIKHAVI